MSDIARLFGNRAGAYASFRPQYPPALFDWLAANSPAHGRALDIACGNGQASAPLRQHFRQVLACDGSPQQLRAAPDLAGIDCFAANVCGPDVEGKPAPDIFLAAAAALAVPPTACVVIEDAPSGVAAAKNGGMRAIGIARLHDETLLASSGVSMMKLRSIFSSYSGILRR